jgi:hypothetical protein
MQPRASNDGSDSNYTNLSTVYDVAVPPSVPPFPEFFFSSFRRVIDINTRVIQEPGLEAINTF